MATTKIKLSRGIDAGWTFVVLLTCYFVNDHHGRQRDLLYKPLCMGVMSESARTSIKDYFRKLRTLR